MKIIDVEQGSDSWLELRKSKITSTGMSSVLNLNPFRSAMEYWRQMVGLQAPTQINAAMRRGMDNEDDARINFIDKTGMFCYPQVIVSDESPWLMSSLDGLCQNSKNLLEIKTPLEKNYQRAINDPIPAYYNIQMQTTFAASDGVIKNGFYGVYSPEMNEINVRSVAPDPKLIETIIAESEIFWRRIREFDAPPPLHEVIETDEMRKAVDQAVFARELVSKAMSMKEDSDLRLKTIAAGRNIQGFGAKITHHFRKGSVDYKRMAEVEKVSLDAYRKPPTEATRITVHG